jgi:hypothetical protein
VIGAATGTGSISASAGATGANVYGVYVASSGTVDCRNNTIAAITTNNAGTFATNFYGIYKSASAGNMYIVNNVIGDDNTPSSINAGSASTSNGQYVYGIYSSGTATVNITITGLNDAAEIIYTLPQQLIEDTDLNSDYQIVTAGSIKIIDKDFGQSDISRIDTQ